MDYNKQFNTCLEQLHDLIYTFEEAKESDDLAETFFEDTYEKIEQLKEELREFENLVKDSLRESSRKQDSESIIEVVAGEDLIAEHPKEEIVAEKSTSLSLEDQIAKKLYSDLKKALSLNDRFRFCRDLFSNSTKLMEDTLGELNGIDSYDESVAYLKAEFHWDWESENVKAFDELLQKRFA